MTQTRAERAKEIRERLGDNQRRFAERLTAMAARLGFTHSYTENLISKLESEYRDTNLEDVAVLEAVDPEERGWFWFAFGRERPTVAKPKERKEPPRAQPAAFAPAPSPAERAATVKQGQDRRSR